MNKIITLSVLLFVSCVLRAQPDINSAVDSLKKVVIPPVDCKAAKDSFEKKQSRGETGFYNTSKFKPGQYFYVTIDKDKYSRTFCPSSYPALNFILCYNKEAKVVLDAAYKVNFLSKADSILNSYDKSGRGYRNADFPGGAQAMQKYMDKNVSLPANVKRDDTSSVTRVYCSFTIDEKGAVSDIKPVKSNCKVCEETIVAAIKKMPAFIPATEAGKPKKIKYILPYIKN